MNLKTMIPIKAMCLVPLTALWLASTPVQAQTAPAKAPTATMPMGQAHMGVIFGMMAGIPAALIAVSLKRQTPTEQPSNQQGERPLLPAPIPAPRPKLIIVQSIIAWAPMLHC